MATRKEPRKSTPQLPIAKRIDIGDLSEVVTAAVQRAMDAQKLATPEIALPPWRIIVGLILESGHKVPQEKDRQP